MYSNVIVGVDGRSGGRDAAALAASLTPEDVRFAIVHVCIVDPLPTRASISTFELASSERALELLETERDLCGHTADTIRVAAKSVGVGLDQIAEERQADLIVVGSCHRHLVGRVVTGDDAASVLHHAHCAVAVAPAGYAGKSRKVETVGLAYDGTPEAQSTLGWRRSAMRSTCLCVARGTTGPSGVWCSVVRATTSPTMPTARYW